MASLSLRIDLADREDREEIYRSRHEVYARELGQHPCNPAGRLRDPLDDRNLYILARGLGPARGPLAGYVSITPPPVEPGGVGAERGGGAPAGGVRYSLDKYLPADRWPFPRAGLYEVRLLTVVESFRARGRSAAAPLLMYAALRWIEARGGERLAAIGRREVLGLYRKAGLELLGVPLACGAVRFELMTATTAGLRAHLARYARGLDRLERIVDWRLDVPFRGEPPPTSPAATGREWGERVGSATPKPQTASETAPRPAPACYHGGRSFEAIGDGFDAPERADAVVSADVLDAWFPPAPAVLDALRDHLPWLVRTSPPTGSAGMIRAVAAARGLDPCGVLPGGGSSDLIFLALRAWLSPASRALILDPMYGEYAHVLERVIGCRVDRLPLARSEGYALDPRRVARACAEAAPAYDLVVLVNPNSPTGRHVPRAALEAALSEIPRRVRVWLDETYVEYAGEGESLERFAQASANTVVCKSMSKVYALSGLRAAYLAGPPALIEPLRPLNPPWAVGLPGQVAAVRALASPDYYRARYAETHALRASLAAGLSRLGLDPLPGVANFVLAHLPLDGPTAAIVAAHCRREGVFLRDAGEMGRGLGTHALRIAVKDARGNARILAALEKAVAAVGGATLRAKGCNNSLDSTEPKDRWMNAANTPS